MLTSARPKLIAIAAAALFLTGAVSKQVPQPNVIITAINCEQDADMSPVLETWNGSTPQSRPLEATREVIGKGVVRLVTYLPPGWNSVKLTGTKRCQANDTIVTLQGHVRHLLFVLRPDVVIRDYDHSIAGAVPDVGLRVSILTKSGKEVPAVVDDGAYYADHLRRDSSYVVRFRLTQGRYVDKPVETTEPGLTTLDLSLDDLAKAECCSL